MTLYLCGGLGVSLLCWAVMTDVAARMVPNWVSIALALDGLAWRIATDAIVLSLIAAVAVFGLATICWRHGLMGGGDVKLLGATALLVRPPAIPSMLLAIALTGGVLGVAYWAMSRMMRFSHLPRRRFLPARIWQIERYRISRGFSLPYASAIAIGTVFAMTRGHA